MVAFHPLVATWVFPIRLLRVGEPQIADTSRTELFTGGSPSEPSTTAWSDECSMAAPRRTVLIRGGRLGSPIKDIALMGQVVCTLPLGASTRPL
jgi:hypothetical protein